MRRRRRSEEARVLRISRLPQEPSAICEQQLTHTHTHHAVRVCACVISKRREGGRGRQMESEG